VVEIPWSGYGPEQILLQLEGPIWKPPSVPQCQKRRHFRRRRMLKAR
jgi:hypothetical protein